MCRDYTGMTPTWDDHLKYTEREEDVEMFECALNDKYYERKDMLYISLPDWDCYVSNEALLLCTLDQIELYFDTLPGQPIYELVINHINNLRDANKNPLEKVG